MSRDLHTVPLGPGVGVRAGAGAGARIDFDVCPVELGWIGFLTSTASEEYAAQVCVQYRTSRSSLPARNVESEQKETSA